MHSARWIPGGHLISRIPSRAVPPSTARRWRTSGVRIFPRRTTVSTLPAHHRPGIDRRLLLRSVLASGAALGLSSCAAAKSGGPSLAADAALPNAVPTGTSLSIASGLGTTQLEVQLAGLADSLPFRVSSWPNLSAGPDVLAAFRAGSAELAVNAGIPPIEAHNQGYDTRIVAINQTRTPTYVFATKPHSTIEAVAE